MRQLLSSIPPVAEGALRARSGHSTTLRLEVKSALKRRGRLIHHPMERAQTFPGLVLGRERSPNVGYPLRLTNPSIEHSINVIPLTGSHHERSVRNDWPRLGQFSRSAKRPAQLAVLRAADDGGSLSALRRHQGCQGGTAGLFVGADYPPGEASAVAPRGLARGESIRWSCCLRQRCWRSSPTRCCEGPLIASHAYSCQRRDRRLQ
jgi:hypothetical protein